MRRSVGGPRSVAVAPSTDEAFRQIMNWLLEEYEQSGEGFYCNRRILERCHTDGDLTVAMLGRAAVGFLAARRSEPWDEMHIMSVKPNLRRRHCIGTALTQEYLDTARANDSIGILIECQPIESATFWSRFGFRPPNDRLTGGLITNYHRKLTFERANGLPDGERARVQVELLRRYYEGSAEEPRIRFDCEGVVADGRMHLERDFIELLPSPDCGVRARLNGRVVCWEKVKYLAKQGGDYRPPFLRIRSLYLNG